MLIQQNIGVANDSYRSRIPMLNVMLSSLTLMVSLSATIPCQAQLLLAARLLTTLKAVI